MQWSEYTQHPARRPLKHVWESLATAVPKLTSPTLYTGKDDEQGFTWRLTWDTGVQCFNIELKSDGQLHWFWYARGEYPQEDGTEDSVREIPSAALGHLAAISSILRQRR